MDLTLSTPALLFPAIAILMLGYINRYLGVATVIRNFKKDYDSGYEHTELVEQLKILVKRIELARYMLTVGVASLILACLSMFFLFANMQQMGNAAFGLSILTMIASLMLSLYETSLSNKSLIIEARAIFDDHTNKKKKSAK